ncbi:MAG: hypothetical protein Kow009_05070 [Spirochaetales bacterium]
MDNHQPAEFIDRMLKGIPLIPKTEYTITDPDIFRQHLQNVHKQGYALDIQENEIGMACVAVPVYNYFGECIASISISGLAARFTRDWVEQNILGSLQETAALVSQALGR